MLNRAKEHKKLVEKCCQDLEPLKLNINLSDPNDREYFLLMSKSHFDPNDIKSIDEIVTLKDVMKKRNREKAFEEIKDFMFPFGVVVWVISIFAVCYILDKMIF